MIIRIGEGLLENEMVTLDTRGQLTTLWGTVVAGIKTEKGFFVVISDGTNISLQWGKTTVFTTEDIGSPEELDALYDSVDID